MKVMVGFREGDQGLIGLLRDLTIEELGPG